jgi:hypothetical protein
MWRSGRCLASPRATFPISTFGIGIRKISRVVASLIQPSIAAPSARRDAAPAQVAKTSSSTPKRNESAVVRIAFLLASPIRSTKPICV